MELIDWNSVWDEQMIITDRSRLNDGAFWDRMAKEPSSGGFPEEMTDFQLSCIGIEGHESVLEIGPGKGRLTIELAKRAGSVTAVDPSAAMTEELSRSLEDAGISNVRLIVSSLEEMDSAQVGRHDVVVASYSLFMMDMRRRLEQMTRSAANRICIFVPADLRVPDELQRTLWGTDADIQIPDHVVLFNLLWQMGLKADVAVQSFNVRKEYADLRSAVDEHMRFHNAPERSRPALERYLSSMLREEDGALVLLSERSTAMLRWRVR